MDLLSLELEVAGHAHDADVGELLQAQEGEGLIGGLVQEVPDVWESVIMSHVDHAQRRSLSGRCVLPGPIHAPECCALVGHSILALGHEGFKGSSPLKGDW